jgi:imidazolonepropionase-like amidohydrolase
LTNTQFALDELEAIMEEAAACGTYVCAHAYTAQAIARAVRCGVRSIEHGNCLDEAAAGKDPQCRS